MQKVQCFWRNFKLKVVLSSRWCQFVLVFALVGGYFLVPRQVFIGENWLVVTLFLALFAMNMVCMVRSIKEKIGARKINKTSWFGLVASLFGLGLVQLCSVNAVMCGSTIGFSLLAIILPGFAFHFVHTYAVQLLWVTVVIQLVSLWSLGCLRFNCIKKAS